MIFRVLSWPESQEAMENPRAIFVESAPNATWAVPDFDGEFALVEWPASQWFVGRPGTFSVGTGVLVPREVAPLAHLFEASETGRRLVDEAGDEVCVDGDALLFADGTRLEADNVVAAIPGSAGYTLRDKGGRERRILLIVQQAAAPSFGPY